MVKLTQHSFMGGQLDYEMLGRQDYSRYAKGATKLVNFNILRRGGIAKRQGFDAALDLCNSPFLAGYGITPTTRVRIVPFAWTKERGFVLVFSPGKIFAVSSAEPDTGHACKVYAVKGGDGVYSSAEIQELDYQQCGDVMFIAHQNHPPAKITRAIAADGEHGFKYENCNFSLATGGRPTVKTAEVNRAPVECKGGTFTEAYVASSVFSDGETLPSAAYSNGGVGQNTGKKSDTGKWTGTSYYLPWTESQKIRVTVTPKRRTGQDGAIQYPTAVRLYKKAFNYYGLISEKKVSGKDVRIGCSTKGTNHLVQITGSSGATLYEGNLGSTPDYGDGRRGYTLASGTTQTVSTASAKGGRFEVMLGHVHKETSSSSHLEDDDGTYSGLRTTFVYVASKATGIQFSGGSKASVSLTPSADRTEYCDQGREESVADYNTRMADEYETFVASISDTVRVTVAITATTKSVGVKAVGGDLVLNAVHAVKPGTMADVTFDDNNIVPDTSVTPLEALDKSLFKGAGNYPSSVSLTQQRLVWASTKREPARVLLSQVGDFYTYNVHQIQRPDDAIDFTLPITRFPKINHIVEMRRLLMFNSACEWMVDSASSASGITYETIQAYPQSYSGSKARLKPLVCNNAVVFCERTGQGVRRFAWDLASDGFAGRDISILSSSIFDKNPIVDWTYQQFPFSTLWCALDDGTAATLEYMEEQEIVAWATHRHGGGKFLGFATTHGISPALDKVGDADEEYEADHEEVFALVQKGYADESGTWHATGLWLERMRPRSKPADTVYHSLCMDSLRICSGAGNGNWPLGWDQAAGEWSDLPQNRGLAYVADLTEDGKVLTKEQALALCQDGKTVYEGFVYNADFMSVFPSVSASTVGAGQFDVKDIGNVGLRLMASHGGTVRAHGCPETEPIRYEDDPGAVKNAVFGGGNARFFDLDASNVKPVGINTRDGRMHVEQALPWPFAVLMYEVDLELEVSRGR